MPATRHIFSANLGSFSSHDVDGGGDAQEMRWTMASNPFSSQGGQDRTGLVGRLDERCCGCRGNLDGDVTDKTATFSFFGSSTCFREGILITSGRGG